MKKTQLYLKQILNGKFTDTTWIVKYYSCSVYSPLLILENVFVEYSLN